MSRKTSKTSESVGKGEALTPGRIVVLALAVLALVFVFENTRPVKIRLLIPEVTVPLWTALLAMWAVGALCGASFAYVRKRRK
ncbi:LapA family protein [Streptomyces rishiriensis]|uniref:Integral membrane protein n=1 Tax=Streptomyces rishiriensis TaxID=68264 RepID=A0ABU0P0Z0_STRRH|nr:LapA family protein [Streptomyces rishiriensis]MDQ0584380.1 putative integral membrane protein [Streptomyces rishiriensis]